MEDAVELVEIELVEKVGRKTGKIVTEVNCNNELLMRRLIRTIQNHESYSCDCYTCDSGDVQKIVVYDTFGFDVRIDDVKKIIHCVVETIKSLKREKINVYV